MYFMVNHTKRGLQQHLIRSLYRCAEDERMVTHGVPMRLKNHVHGQAGPCEQLPDNTGLPPGLVFLRGTSPAVSPPPSAYLHWCAYSHDSAPLVALARRMSHLPFPSPAPASPYAPPWPFPLPFPPSCALTQNSKTYVTVTGQQGRHPGRASD